MKEQISVFDMAEDETSVFTEADVNNEQEEDVAKNGIDAINQMAISETDWTTETIVRQIERGNIILDPDLSTTRSVDINKTKRLTLSGGNPLYGKD